MLNAHWSRIYAILAWKASNSKYSDLTKCWHLSAHFGLKYLSNDGINRDRFHCKNFPKIHTFRLAKRSRANFEWTVPLTCNQKLMCSVHSWWRWRWSKIGMLKSFTFENQLLVAKKSNFFNIVLELRLAGNLERHQWRHKNITIWWLCILTLHWETGEYGS